jgi:hypothetical protein
LNVATFSNDSFAILRITTAIQIPGLPLATMYATLLPAVRRGSVHPDDGARPQRATPFYARLVSDKIAKISQRALKWRPSLGINDHGHHNFRKCGDRRRFLDCSQGSNDFIARLKGTYTT